MKKTILFALMLLASASTFAQETEKKESSTERISFGLKAGFTFPVFASKGVTANTVTNSSLTSYYGGVFVSVPIVKGFSIQPGATLIGKGGSVKFNDVSTEYKPLYLEVPVNVVGALQAGPGKVIIGAGPYASWGISGKVKIGDEEAKNIEFGTGKTGLKSFDWGINFLAGYQLDMGLGINAGYSIGMNNIQSNDTVSETFNRGVWSLGLVLAF